ncbi:MAG: hypothetical protein M1836_006515 [Candelina mexicana]|nr:MAG: hypothetical protein M1836_006515 [Candelina mexicana]
MNSVFNAATFDETQLKSSKLSLSMSALKQDCVALMKLEVREDTAVILLVQGFGAVVAGQSVDPRNLKTLGTAAANDQAASDAAAAEATDAANIEKAADAEYADDIDTTVEMTSVGSAHNGFGLTA